MACRSALCRGISFSARSAVSLAVPRIARSAAGPCALRAGQLTPRLKHVVCGAVASGSTEAEAAYSNVSGGESNEDRMQELVVFLRQELPELFRTGTVTTSRYSSEIEFVDPITRATNFQQYSIMIRALATVFKNKFELFDIAVTAPNVITARWSLQMQFKLAPILPWTPTASFTGTTEYTIDPYNGLIRKHVDKWDSIQDNENLSLEGLRYTLSSFTQPTSTPNLETPEYSIMYRSANYEVRKYPSFLVAETPMAPGSNATSGSGFNELAGYIFGGNQGSQNMEMTTPVFSKPAVGSSEPAKMQFVMERRFPSTESLPKPKEGAKVEPKVEEVGLVAAATFSGWPLETEVVAAEKNLRSALLSADMSPKESYVLARYNDPFTPPFLRRNEILIQLDGFDLPDLPQPVSMGASLSSLESSDIDTD